MPGSVKSPPLLLALLCLTVPAAAPATCSIQSPPHRVALVELYTSEGCSSCPPADRWLGELSQRFSAEHLLALSLHVDYWDTHDWQDPYAQAGFSQRQRWLSRLAGAGTIYTPEVFTGMQEVRGWRNQTSFAERIQAINRLPARADIRLQMRPGIEGAVDVEARFALKEGQHGRTSEGVVVVYENHLVSEVRAGENSGLSLRHEHVVRYWSPRLVLNEAPTIWRQTFRFPAGWQRGNLGVAAFVQDLRAGEVLQAVAMPGCV